MKTLMNLFVVALVGFSVGVLAADVATVEGRTHQTQEQQSTSSEKRISNTVSVNNLILGEYADRFERNTPADSHGDGEVEAYFRAASRAKIISQPMSAFPVQAIFYGVRLPGASKLPGRSVAGNLEFQQETTWAEGLQLLEEARAVSAPDIVCYGGSVQQVASKTSNPQVAQLLAAAVFAHVVTSEIADKLEKEGLKSKRPHEAVAAAFDAVNYHAAAEKAWEAWLSQVPATCLTRQPLVTNYNNCAGLVGEPVLQCGSIYIDAKNGNIKMNGRQTLSNENINGRRVDVATSTGTSNSKSKSTSRSKDSRINRQ